MSQKRENFVRLAEARVNRALREIRLIGNLSNRSAYTYSEADIREIFRAIQREIDSAKVRFGADGSAGESEFRLKSNG